MFTMLDILLQAIPSISNIISWIICGQIAIANKTFVMYDKGFKVDSGNKRFRVEFNSLEY